MKSQIIQDSDDEGEPISPIQSSSSFKVSVSTSLPEVDYNQAENDRASSIALLDSKNKITVHEDSLPSTFPPETADVFIGSTVPDNTLQQIQIMHQLDENMVPQSLLMNAAKSSLPWSETINADKSDQPGDSDVHINITEDVVEQLEVGTTISEHHDSQNEKAQISDANAKIPISSPKISLIDMPEAVNTTIAKKSIRPSIRKNKKRKKTDSETSDEELPRNLPTMKTELMSDMQRSATPTNISDMIENSQPASPSLPQPLVQQEKSEEALIAEPAPKKRRGRPPKHEKQSKKVKITSTIEQLEDVQVKEIAKDATPNVDSDKNVALIEKVEESIMEDHSVLVSPVTSVNPTVELSHYSMQHQDTRTEYIEPIVDDVKENLPQNKATSKSTLDKNGKPLYRVGLSKRQRIAPLLRVVPR